METAPRRSLCVESKIIPKADVKEGGLAYYRITVTVVVTEPP